MIAKGSMIIRVCIVSMIICFGAAPSLFAGSPIWIDGFEGDWQSRWSVDAGTWQVGRPTSGPGGVYNGVNSAATVLAGNYGNNVSSRLIRHESFVVPPAAQEPGLRFWHWFEFFPDGGDYGQVQIRVFGETEWTDLSTIVNSGGGAWTHAYVPLSDYEGQRVEIAFYFHSNNAFERPGWYIDDVSLEVGPRVFISPQDWEAGLGDWHVESGSWEVGTPNSGPGSAYSPSKCVGTRLAGNYTANVDARLISPPFVICPAIASPALRFWHWFEFFAGGDDYGQVQIRVFGETEWTELTKYINNSSAVWTHARIPLSSYVGQTVEIAFYFHSNNAFERPGWYIDDVQLEGLTPLISSAPIGKYLPDDCTASIRVSAQDPCGADLYYNWHIPEGCVLTGTDSNVQIQCLGGGTDPYQVTVSVESETSHVASQEKTISIFTQVLYDLDGDGDIDGSDLRQFAGAFAPSELERFALEFGLIACQ